MAGDRPIFRPERRFGDRVEGFATRTIQTQLIGQPGGWSLLVRYGLAERALAAQRSKQVRVFRKLDTLQAYLEEIGVRRFEVDAANFRVAPRQ